jgi:chorismate dehydratase
LTAKRAAKASVSYQYVYDLGAAWKAWTDLPFVFAVWVAQRATASDRALATCAALRSSRDWGLANLATLAEQAAAVTGVGEGTCLEYLSGLDYGLSYAHLAGLTEFLRRLVVAGRVPDGSLAFLTAA